jgi:hypothetical protein
MIWTAMKVATPEVQRSEGLGALKVNEEVGVVICP